MARPRMSMEEVLADPLQALAYHDSHTCLEAVGALVRTGPTGTNVNDLAVVLAY